MNSFCFQGKPFNITVTQVYSLTSNAEEAEIEWFYEDIQDHLDLGYKKSHPFHYRGLKCKSRKSRNTWSNRQIWLWNAEWNRAQANRTLPREFTDHSKHPLPTTWEEDSTQGCHQMVNTKTGLIIFFAAKDGEALYSQQKQDQELTVAQIMNFVLPNSDLNWRK